MKIQENKSYNGVMKEYKTCLKFTNILQWAIYEKYGLIQCILKIKREFSNVYLVLLPGKFFKFTIIRKLINYKKKSHSMCEYNKW